MDDARFQPGGDRSESHNWKRDELVARILRRWRELTGDKNTRDRDRRTLIACSGGADSVALAFALSRIPGACVIAHIRHDIRLEAETKADQGLVQSLADAWGVPCVVQDLLVKDQPGNLEANARAGRYAILQGIANEQGCHFIAIGHHADDQLETILMHLMRGSGVRGMRGMSPLTQFDEVPVIRPMLDVSRDEIEQLLMSASIAWREDETNRDVEYLRNRIRHELVPVMRSICPEIAYRASDWSDDLMQIRSMMEHMVDDVVQKSTQTNEGMNWDRAVFRSCPEPILGMLPHSVCADLCANAGQDSISRETIRAWIRSVKSGSTDPSRHRIGPMVCFIDAHHVRFVPASDEHVETEVHHES